jgi:hypothetical protein
MKMEQTVFSETSAYGIQTPGNYPEENIQQKFYSLRNCPRGAQFVKFVKNSAVCVTAPGVPNL